MTPADALHESDECFRLLVDRVKDYAIFMLDLDGRIISWNIGAQRLKGYTAEEIIGRPFSCLYLPEDVACGKPEQELREAFEAGHFEEEGWRLRKDGSRFFASISITALRDEAGTLRGFAKVTHDITEHKRTEEKLRRQAEALSQANADLEQFAYVASHDLQEPLRMITSYCQMLEQRYKGRLDEKADKYIGYAVGAAVRMQRLINDLLAYARVGSQHRELEPTDCQAAFAQAFANLYGIVQESGALVSCDPLPTVTGDEAQLVRLFQNLIGNAIKYHGPEPPRVHLSAERRRNEWLFSVHDNGIGIDPQYYERIFTIFQRLHNQNEYEGTGIGLAICKKIVERHGGHIWVESKPGQGSVFYFTLPVHTPGRPHYSRM